ncbi:MAG: zinc finger DksA/TraR C4-type [Gammaproteobacteria bacterium]|nr:MAG: zinc finger DksA/TraR C4-type [Gammaproteobacteria bacterium]TND05784.1 MAG: zinc finger DksA/TraR C4-type [Gammaproteobacteria bacterium]
MAELTRKQTDELKQLLDRRHQELRADVRQELADSGDERFTELTSSVRDIGEESTTAVLADVNLSLINRHTHEMNQIERALQHIERGDYGICVDCGADIPFERLQGYPVAERCVSCQGRYEKTHLSHATPRL